MREANEPPTDPRPSIELLESTHQFPGSFRIKAIGRSEGDFVSRAVAEARAELVVEEAVVFRVLPTPQGRHVSVTLDLNVETAEQVRAVYGRLMRLEGLVLLL